MSDLCQSIFIDLVGMHKYEVIKKRQNLQNYKKEI